MSSYSEFTRALVRFVPIAVARKLSAELRPPAEPCAETLEAAVLFTDISGFTPLAEKYARSGPEGVEHLTRILNSCFGQLVDLVAEHGGDVLRFAGDALLAIWPARDQPLDEAALRSVQCGVEMQARLHGYDAGEGVRLGLKTALAAGEVLLAHVGGHRGRWQYLAAGPVLDQLAVVGHAWSNGGLFASDPTWKLVADRCLGVDSGEGLVRIGEVRRALEPRALDLVVPPDEAVDSLTAYVSGPVRARLEAGHEAWLAERRQVTMIFLSLPGITHELETIQRASVAIQESIFAYEGTISQILFDDKGFVVVAVFGLPPLAHEDDPVRACDAVLAAGAALEAAGFEWAAGVTTGRVLCGTVGNGRRSEYATIGDVVNLAARLMQAAGSTAICDQATCEAARSHFEFESLGSISLKGKSRPIERFRPTARRRAQTRHARMVGRERELQQLRDGLRAARQGLRAVALVEGEAGIGKSCLVDALAREAREQAVGVLVGSGDAVEKSSPYHAWRPVFAGLLQVGPEDEQEAARERVLGRLAGTPLEELAPLLEAVVPLGIPESSLTRGMSGVLRSESTQRLLVGLLQEETSSSPLVVVLEDLHWLDSMSFELADRIQRQVTRMLLVMTSRPGMEASVRDWPGVVHLPLKALEANEALALVSERLGVREVPRELGAVLERAGGNPFFVEELVHAVRDAGGLQVEGGTCRLAEGLENLNGLPLPTTLEGLVTSRVDRLQPSEQLLLKTASVVGRVFPMGLVTDIYPVPRERPELPTHAASLVRADLTRTHAVTPDLAYIFHHVITQEVAYAMLLGSQRRELHRTVAERFEKAEGEVDQSLLWWHRSQAGDQDRAIHHAERAGEAALLAGAFQEAAKFLEIVLEAAQEQAFDPLRESRCRRQLGDALVGLGRLNDGRQMLEKALAILGWPVPASRAGLGTALLRQVGVQVGYRLFPPRPLEGEERERHLEGARALLTLSEIYFMDSQQELLAWSAVRGLNLAERAGTCPELAVMYANAVTGTDVVGLHGVSERYAQAARRTADEVGLVSADAWVTLLTGVHALVLGQMERAKADLESSAENWERLGARRRLAQTRALLGEWHSYRGQFGVLREVAAILEEEDLGPQVQNWSTAYRCRALVPAGGYEEALELAQAALERVGNRLVSAEALVFVGIVVECLYYLGRLDEAQDSAERCLDVMGAPTILIEFTARAACADVLLRLWERDPLDRRIQRSASRACRALDSSARVFPLQRPRALTCSGLHAWISGRRHLALRRWREAAELASRLEQAYELARAQTELGRHLPPGADRVNLLTAAIEGYARVGAVPDERLARRFLEDGGRGPTA